MPSIVHREITRCEALVEGGGLTAEVPARARWYPARVCYGRQFELVFSTEEEVDEAELKVGWSGWGASAEAFASEHKLELMVGSRGFKRSASCKKLIFTTPEEFEGCFGDLEEDASVPILVEWVELPSQAKRRRKKKRANARSEKQPCAKWRFTKATYDPPKRGLEIRMTLRWPNGGRRVYRGVSAELADAPVVKTGERVGYLVEDVDLVFDDKLASGAFTVPRRLDDGKMMKGGLTLHGRCEQRQKPRKKNSQKR